MDCHADAKCRDLLRKRCTCVGNQPIAPHLQRPDGAGMETRDLHVSHLRGELRRGHLCRVKNLVRIGVADSAEQMRIGQGALDRVVLATEGGGELSGRRLEDFKPSGIVTLERVKSANQIQRCPAPESRFGQQ